jgi:hypothetical protein
MISRNAAIVRRSLIALIAVALVGGGIVFAFRAGCAHSAAGSTAASADFQLAADWLMIPGLTLLAALFAMPVIESTWRVFVRVIGFLLLAFPISIGVLMYAESEGDGQKQTCAKSFAL